MFVVDFVVVYCASEDTVDLCIYITGPGLNSPEERTINYLEEVAIECARGIVNKKIPLRKEKGMMQSKKFINI